jgi:hypothetical protein
MSQTLKKHCLIGILFSALFFINSANSQNASESERWIMAANVNLREQPSLNAKIQTRLPLNTVVKLLNESAGQGFCEVQWESLTGGMRVGFTACQYLGKVPLVLDKGSIEQSYLAGSLTRKDEQTYEQIFWKNPSYENLFIYGKILESTRLSEKQKEIERAMLDLHFKGQPQKPINRPKNELFESMKIHLTNGFVSNNYPNVLVEWVPNKKFNLNKNTDQAMENIGISLIKLPVVKTSFFKSQNQVNWLLSTEQASATMKTPYSLTITSGIRYFPASTYVDAHLAGSWDIGQAKAELIAPVFELLVKRNGGLKQGKTTLKSTKLVPDSETEFDCKYGFEVENAGHLDPTSKNYRADLRKLNPTVAKFYFKAPIDTSKSKIRIMKEKYKIGSELESAEQFHYDFDGDGKDDFIVWEGTGLPEQRIHEPNAAVRYIKHMFVNAGGKWYHLNSETYTFGCGC